MHWSPIFLQSRLGVMQVTHLSTMHTYDPNANVVLFGYMEIAMAKFTPPEPKALTVCAPHPQNPLRS